MRPTGKLHLGNYWGALEQWIEKQKSEEYEGYYMIADWHFLTTKQDTDSVEEDIIEMVKDWLVCGLDPKKSTIFRQSWVPAHANLYLILSMITPLSWLERIPTYKDQVNQVKPLEDEKINHGFLSYPVLQAADILLYKADCVPIGKDQLAHLELSKQIARRFNHMYPVSEDNNKWKMKVPKPILSPKADFVMGLDTRKMSKSYQNSIALSDSISDLQKKINRMFTSPLKIKKNDPGYPEPCQQNPTGCVVFSMHKIYESKENDLSILKQDCKEGKLGCYDCKKKLFNKMKPQWEKYLERRSKFKKEDIKDIILEGSQDMNKKAEANIKLIRKQMQFKSIHHKWTEQDDILSFYLTCLEIDGADISELVKTVAEYINKSDPLYGMNKISSIKSKIRNFYYLVTDGREGLRNFNLLSKKIYERWENVPIEKLLQECNKILETQDLKFSGK